MNPMPSALLMKKVFMTQLFIKTAPIALVSLLMACEPAEQTASEPVIRPAKIIQVTNQSDTAIRKFPATVEANQGATLAFRVSGEIEAFLVKPGEQVKEGQLLVQLDDEDFKIRLNDRKARFELAKAQYERAKVLEEKNLASQAQLDEAKANLLIAQAELDSAESDLKHTELRAPYAGSISKTYVKNRENIQAKENILRLMNRDRVDISIQVPEHIFARVKRGSNYQPSVTFDALPDQPFLLTVKEWDTQADPITLTYKVVFSLPSPEQINVLPGMSAQVHIDLSQITDTKASQIVLPVEAVFAPEGQTTSNDEGYVWKYDSDSQQVSLHKVTLGQVHQQGVEILTGVEVGEQVVTAGVHSLKAGMKVKPWNKERGL